MDLRTSHLPLLSSVAPPKWGCSMVSYLGNAITTGESTRSIFLLLLLFYTWFQRTRFSTFAISPKHLWSSRKLIMVWGQVSKHNQCFKLIFATVRNFCVGLLVPFISLCWSEASANSQVFIDRRRVGYIPLHGEFVHLLMLGDPSRYHCQNRSLKWNVWSESKVVLASREE